MTFSGGMRRRLEIARGFLHSPRVLFLDEPTIGLDPQTRSSIWRYIRALQQTRGDHDLHDHPLHGRGRVLRSDRDHGSRRDRRARHAGGAQGPGRRRPGDDPHRRRRRRRGRARRALRARRARSPRAPSRSTCPRARSSCPVCSPSSACRSDRSTSPGRRSTTSSWPTPARRSATPRRSRRGDATGWSMQDDGAR